MKKLKENKKIVILLVLLFFFMIGILFYVFRGSFDSDEYEDELNLLKYTERQEIKTEKQKDRKEIKKAGKGSREQAQQAALKDLIKPQNLGMLPYTNISDLELLLSRSDLCSAIWYEDVEDYLDLLKKQNETLLTFEMNEEMFKLVEKQDLLIHSLEEFLVTRKKDEILNLEIASKQYLDFALDWEIDYHEKVH